MFLVYKGRIFSYNQIDKADKGVGDMKRVRHLSLLLALCVLLAGVPAAWTEDAIVSAPVDDVVEELQDAELWTGEVAGDVAVAELEAGAEEAMLTGEGVPFDETHFPDEAFRQYLASAYGFGADSVLSTDGVSRPGTRLLRRLSAIGQHQRPHQRTACHRHRTCGATCR